MASVICTLQFHRCETCNHIDWHMAHSENWRVEKKPNQWPKIIFTPPSGPKVHYLMPEKTTFVQLYSNGTIKEETDGENFKNLSRIHKCAVKKEDGEPPSFLGITLDELKKTS